MVTGSQIFYADAQHHVFVTDSMFIIKDKEYNLPSIRDHIIKEIKPTPTAGFVVAIVGTILLLGGVFHFIALRFMPNVTLLDFTFGAFSWSILMGALILFGGLFMIAMAKPKYALHISTSEGENDVLVSPRREYIRQIIDALNRAFMLRVK